MEKLPWTLIRRDRLELLESLAQAAVVLSYRIANSDGDLGPDEARLWDLHDVASQYECYEHQRSLGFPPAVPACRGCPPSLRCRPLGEACVTPVVIGLVREVMMIWISVILGLLVVAEVVCTVHNIWPCLKEP